MWVGLFPEISNIGGIQQVSRHAGAVLINHARQRNVPCELLGWNDPRGKGSFRVGTQEYEFTGFGRNKLALFFYLLRLMPRIETLVLGHVNLAPIGLLLRFARPRMQYCVVTHGVEVWEPLSMFRRLGLQHAQRVIAVSEYTKTAMVKTHKLNPQRIDVLAPALDPTFTEDSCDGSSFSLPPDALAILTVGRLISSEPGKGIESVIEVLPNVLKAVPNVFYVVVGEGDLRPRLEELAREYAVQDRVIFTGPAQIEQLKSYYKRADVFVMPSRQEGFGIVFLEAMFFGKSVVAGDHGGAPEVVQDGVTGFSVNPDDLEMLAGHLVQLLRDEALRTQMGAAGRKRLEEIFTFPPFAKKLTQILDTIGHGAS